MDFKIVIISFACYAFAGLVATYKYLLPQSLWRKGFKPLDCAFCLSFWASLLILDLPIFERIGYALAAAGIAKLIDKI